MCLKKRRCEQAILSKDATNAELKDMWECVFTPEYYTDCEVSGPFMGFDRLLPELLDFSTKMCLCSAAWQRSLTPEILTTCLMLTG